MTIQEAIKDLRDGDEGRVMECLDSGDIFHDDQVNVGQAIRLAIASITSTRWITRDAR